MGRPLAPVRQAAGVMPSMPDDFFVEAAAGVKTRLVDRLGDRAAAGKFATNEFGALGGSPCAGSEPGDLAEDPMEVKRTEANGSGESLE